MFGASFAAPADRPLRVLLLGAHADDIELGCGATLLELAAQRVPVEFCWVVATGDEVRAGEARESAPSYVSEPAALTIVVGDLREGYLPYLGEAPKQFLHDVAQQFEPDVVFTHRSEDRHQDHRILNELAGNAFRRQPIFAFEIPKYDGDLATPNVYVPVSEQNAHRKVELLFKHYESQKTKPWFDEAVFLGLMRLRGLECNSPSGFAEGFACRKMAISWGARS
jgi:LmbE family N-acetylglucosaminyl deacetylase